MSKLWLHEAQRVFHDRLINKEDKSWFNELSCDLMKNVFRMDWSVEMNE